MGLKYCVYCKYLLRLVVVIPALSKIPLHHSKLLCVYKLKFLLLKFLRDEIFRVSLKITSNFLKLLLFIKNLT
jgi:hypothetical protein